jgi:delta24-sterol reductase
MKTKGLPEQDIVLLKLYDSKSVFFNKIKPLAMKDILESILTRHRGLVIFAVAVPVSFAYQIAQDIRNWFFRTFLATNKLHEREVQKIQSRVREAAAEGRLMCTARKPWKTMSQRKADFKADCAQIPIELPNILELDEARQVVRVEPMATMGDLTHYLVPRGYALAVQVEMDDLTVGGLCMGVGIETSSHRYGFLFETIEAYEIVTARGEFIRATRTQHADLFYALPWSHGTLGFLVAVELRVVPVKPYMRLRYIPCHSQEAFCEQFRILATAEQPPAYLEALAFAPDAGVIMVGEPAEVDTPEKRASINRINRWYKPWFYSHVQTFLEKGETEEYIPLRHYFHRHTPSVFFQLKDLIPFANTAWYRWLFAWMGAPKIKLMKYTMTRSLRRRSLYKRVAQDIIVPIGRMAEAINFMHPRFGIYPMWICPVRICDHHPHEGFLRNPEQPEPGRNDQMFVDLGIYGIPQDVRDGKPWDAKANTRALEEMARRMKGYQMLYADTFMTRGEFEEMFNHETYREVRHRYGADQAFPEVYDKVRPERWLLDMDREVAGQQRLEQGV